LSSDILTINVEWRKVTPVVDVLDVASCELMAWN